MSKVFLKNIGTIVSGDIQAPILPGDAIVVSDGLISAVGNAADLSAGDADRIIDCAGTTVTPGLMDSHCHSVLMDYTPRQKQIGFLESAVHGGVTTFVSAGEVHLTGRPKDPAGAKALAILAAKAFENFRPGGGKVVGGAVILEKGLTEADFQEMAAQGVRLVGEIGLGSVKDPEDAAPMVRWAKAAGMTVMMHTGGTSIPGSSTVTAEMVIRTDPDVASHINGGPTAVALDEARRLITETGMAIEMVHCGNPKMALDALEICITHNALKRVIIGNDAPSGTGVVPLGILRTLVHLASLSDLPAEAALCMATGNTGRVHKLGRGIIAQGKPSDLAIMDTPMGSVGTDTLTAIKAGDLPAVAMVLVDGEVVVAKSRNTPPPVRKPQVQ